MDAWPKAAGALRWTTGIACLLVLTAIAPLSAQQPLARPAQSAIVPEDGSWRMPAKDFANTRFSGLDQINTQNVARLGVAWTFSTGVNRGQESAPLVIGDTLYLVTPYPNILYALDLRAGGALKWSFQPNPEASSQGSACCDTVNRGPTWADGTIYFNTLDVQTVAVDAATGQERWRTKLGDFAKGETMTMAPLVVNGKVLVGNSGGEFGVRGWLTALDAKTGATAWRAYSTGPDADVMIGSGFKPFYEAERGRDLGVSTWPAGAWQQGGGTVWGWLSYDPALNLVYYGTSNPSPWNHKVRPGDNKWTAGVFARDPDTGQAHWFYQANPHDIWDHDAVNESVLLDLPWQGQTRQVLLRPERNGYMYVIDRATGEVLSADPFVPITTSSGVDLKTGRLQVRTEKEPKPGQTVRDVCPSAPGAKDWNPSAFSPKTGWLYVPHNQLCMDWALTDVSYIAGTPYVGAEERYHAAPGSDARGEMMAWDPVARRKAWTIQERFPLWSGALTTAGGLVFYGNLEGLFKAVDARSGKVLWQFRTGSGIIGQPTSFRGPDGRQYVAILSGIGGWAGAIVSADLDPRDQTAGNGWGGAVGDLKQVTTKGGTLYVFALPQ
jgi:lanthanide-dependent methanol dehydrogenase